MSVIAAILIFGACGSASRTVVVEPPIALVLFHVALGGANGLFSQAGSDATGSRIGAHLRKGEGNPPAILFIDGERRTGWTAWAIAAVKIAGFITDAWPSGSVEWYRASAVRGVWVWRHTEVRDGFVRLTADIRGPMGPRGELHRVLFTITAVEGSRGTTITATATGWTNIGRRCRLVARIAAREISKGLQRDLLGAVESGGRRLYASGDVGKIVDVFVARMR